MKMNIIVCTLLLIMQPVYAQAGEAQDPGVTPDSFLYGLDVALDRITLLLTFDQAEKSRKGLEIARERLLEVEKMAEENKLEAMQKAQEEHSKALGTVQASVTKLQRDNPTEEIEEEIEIERELEEHKQTIEQMKGELKVRIEIKGDVTAEQQALIDSILGSLENKTGEVEIEIENKKSRTKIKIKQETGMSDEEIEDEIEGLEEKKGLTKIRLAWAQKAIESAEEKLQKAQEKINEKKAEGVNVTIAEDYLRQVDDSLAQAKEALNATEYRRARELARDAGKLAMHAKRGKSFGEDEDEEAKVEIKVEIEDSHAKVKVEIGDEESEVTLNTANKGEIISEIASRTGLTREEIEGVIEFEEKLERHREQGFEVGEEAAAEIEISDEESEVEVNLDIEHSREQGEEKEE